MAHCRIHAWVFLAGALLVPETTRSEPVPTWPQWRGPTRDGRLAGAAAWPDKLDKDSLQQLWRVELGPSYSGPVVAPDRVFITETIDGKEEVVRALRRSNGKELWKASWTGHLSVPAYAKVNGEWMRSTPAYDGTSLFVGGMREVVVALDADTGKERWRVDFPKLYKTDLPVFGQVSSPLVDGDSLFVQVVAGVVCLDKQTGKVRWRKELDKSREFGATTASPVVGTLAGKRQLIVLQRKVLAGLDLSDGTILWQHKVPAYRNTSTLTPLLLGEGGVFTSMFAGRSLRFDVTAKESRQVARIGWDSAANAYMSSPVLVGDFIYLHLENQRIACLNCKTGKQAWRTSKTFGKYWSMVANGDRILALDQDGTLYLLKANPARFDLLDKRRITEDEAWAHLAVVGDALFIREQKALAVYRWRKAAASGPPK